jgi:hypothetical protein
MVKLLAPAAGAPGLFPSVVLIAGFELSVVVAASAGAAKRFATARLSIIRMRVSPLID